MDADWIKSPSGERVVRHIADPRPAWLWPADGSDLIWQNAAAELFRAKLKKSGLKVKPVPVPIKGQISRLLRLGSLNRKSRAHVQFLAGTKPVSATCDVTPVTLADGAMGILIVGNEPVDADIREAAEMRENLAPFALVPEGTGFAVIDAQGEVVAGGGPLPDDMESGVTLRAGPRDEKLVLFAPGVAEPTREEVIEEHDPLEAKKDTAPPEPPAEIEHFAAIEEPVAETGQRELTALFDRLAMADSLYAPLDDDVDDEPWVHVPAVEPEDVFHADLEDEDRAEDLAKDVEETISPVEPVPEVEAPGTPAGVEDDVDPSDGAMLARLYRVTGRGYRPAIVDGDVPEPVGPTEGLSDAAALSGGGEDELAPDAPAVEIPLIVAPVPPAPEMQDRPTEEAPIDADLPEITSETSSLPPDAEIVERVSRYNFDELSRILTDRVGGEPQRGEGSPPAPARQAELINLTGETFVLNRLPLGILVFRDQQVLFANRALTDMTGYENSEKLRAHGLEAIFPGSEEQSAGPVTRLLKADGTPVPVNARLQSITWQGRPALMLSAGLADTTFGHEAAVRTFAELLAQVRDEGFIELSRAGAIEAVSAHASVLFGRTADELIGQPVSALASKGEIEALRGFLERPARFAETARPVMMLSGQGYEITLFAKGQAGIVSGYLGMVRRPAATAMLEVPAPSPSDTGLLSRLSRNVRRPLNTIVGFAELLKSAEYGPIEPARQAEYAADIQAAGREITDLIDELDEFARLTDGRYASRPADFELGMLLEDCVMRVRAQANAARVIVRSAISETLPRIRADRASLAQAVLNLLASAIAETPAGHAVVLSAQREDDGGLSITVRDAAGEGVDPIERFVVFRDGQGRNGEALAPMRSTVGLALTRSLLAVNAVSLSVDPTGGAGTLFALSIPKGLVITDS